MVRIEFMQMRMAFPSHKFQALALIEHVFDDERPKWNYRAIPS
jgi:hypothetical protein